MEDKSRRITGLLFGLGMGLLYGLVSQSINRLLLSDLPLYQPPPGGAMGVLIDIVIGGLMGLATAWPFEALVGVLLGAAVPTLLGSFLSYLTTAELTGEGTAMLILLLVIFLPRVVIFLPISGVVRWVIGDWGRELESINFSTKRMALTLGGLLLLAMLGGLSAMYSAEARSALRQTNDLVLKSLRITSADQLPEPLLAVDGLVTGASGGYTLRLSEELDNLPIPRPFADFGESQYAVLVVFDNGFRFACIWTFPQNKPVCGEY